MKQLSKTQKVIFVLGVLGTVLGLFGKFNGWEHDDYFPIFYTGMSFMWIAFLKSGKQCYNPFKRQLGSANSK
ncbi:hypothetical protein [Flagellimonas myxillae]|uniref:hypothetical protein n=1 Tax=Flagellimonas myxillae TaxID=2942214 RepID=UPI00201F59E4|nr:hypothetical protein [Muricauda myxillae]MCL6264903.1 hypothetical protein [Muricauda myxillae]